MTVEAPTAVWENLSGPAARNATSLAGLTGSALRSSLVLHLQLVLGPTALTRVGPFSSPSLVCHPVVHTDSINGYCLDGARLFGN